MIAKTEAIALRIFPFSETSRVVSWLCRDTGRLTTMIKGAQRPKSLHLGQVDLFYTCEVLFYEKDSRSVHILKECAPIHSRPNLRRDWKACASASYLADLVYRISPHRAHHPGLYAALEVALTHLDQYGSRPAFLFWFELKLLHLLGLAPRFRHCAHCGTELIQSSRPAIFAYGGGGIHCPSCTTTNDPHALHIAPDVLATLAAWQRAPSARSALATRSTERQLHEIESVLGLFLRFHLELELKSRTIALQLLRFESPAAASG